MLYAEPPEQPTIGRSPSTLSRTAVEGSNPANQTFTVANSGDGTLEYTITDNVPWLSASPSNGTSTGETDTITVIYNTASLPAGQYSGTITISDPDATNDPQTIAVSLTVQAATSPGFYQVGWNLTSVPVVPTNPAPFSVFQDLTALGNVIDNNLYRYATGAGYELYPLHFTTVTRGRGYWLWLSTVQPDTVVTVPGQVATSSVELSLPQGWSLIGHPFPESVLLSSCLVKNGATTYGWSNAVAAGWIAGGLYYWDPDTGYLTLNSTGYGHDDSLRPWRGYWAYAPTTTVSLIVPKP
jgi:hypothetical protein